MYVYVYASALELNYEVVRQIYGVEMDKLNLVSDRSTTSSSMIWQENY